MKPNEHHMTLETSEEEQRYLERLWVVRPLHRAGDGAGWDEEMLSGVRTVADKWTTSLLEMRPQPNNFDNFLSAVDLVDNAVLDIDSS